jgi:2-methylcitrate dehydratase PrpD
MGGDYDPALLTADLGKRFEGENIGDKPYPCCGLTHACIDAALDLKTKYKIDADAIKEVTVYGGDKVYQLAQPPEIKKAPRTIIDAQFSVPYVVAVALVRGKVTVEDFTEAAIKRPEVLEVAQRIDTRLEPSMDRHGVGPGGVTITMRDGTRYNEEVENCRGSVARPMTLEDVTRKFRECAPSSIKPLPADEVEGVIEMVGQLENLTDATEIIRRLG